MSGIGKQDFLRQLDEQIAVYDDPRFKALPHSAAVRQHLDNFRTSDIHPHEFNINTFTGAIDDEDEAEFVHACLCHAAGIAAPTLEWEAAKMAALTQIVETIGVERCAALKQHNLSLDHTN